MPKKRADPGPPEVNPSPLLVLANQYQASCALVAAVRLDLFTALAAKPLPAREVAAARTLPVRGTERLLNAMTALGLLEAKEGRYALAPLAATFLVRGTPRSLCRWVEERGRTMEAWMRLADAVRDDAPLQPHQDDAVTAMSQQELDGYILGLKQVALQGAAHLLAERLDLGGAKALLDVGGGHGAYACVLAARNPGLRVVLHDLPPVVRLARETVKEFGLEKRVTTWEGDFKRDQFGNGFDAALLSNVLQTEGAATAKTLLKKVHEALNPGGLVAVHGVMRDPTGTGPAPSVLSSLMFLLFFPEGDAYTTEDYAAWLEQTGFEDVRVERLPPPSGYTLVTARKPARA